jgi:hypothetical protein
MPRLIHAPVMVCGLVSVVLGLSYEPQHRELRKRQKGAIDGVLETTELLLDWPEGRPRSKEPLWQQVDERMLQGSLEDLRTFKRLEERGYGDALPCLCVQAHSRLQFCQLILGPRSL